MNWLLALACAAMAALMFGAARSARQPPGPRSTALMHWSLAIAPAFVILCLATSYGRMDQVRLVLTGVSADARALRTETPSRGGPQGVSIGGGAGEDRPLDDVVSPGLPAGLVTVRQVGDQLQAQAWPQAGSADRVGMVSTGLRDRLSFVGGHPMSPGDQVCLERCDRGGRWLTLAPGGERLVESATGQPLLRFPVRKLFRAIEGIADWGAGQRIYPLRDFGRPETSAGDRQSSEDLCGVRFLCVADPVSRKPTPARSFLYRRGGPSLLWAGGERTWIVLLDPGAMLRTADGEVFRPLTSKALLSVAPDLDEETTGKGEAVDLSVWSVRYADASDPADPEAAPSRLVERRAMRLTLTGGGLSITFKSPPVAVGNQIGDPPARSYRVAGATAGAAQAGNSGSRLDFPALGGAMAQRTAGWLTLDRQKNLFDVISEGGRTRLTFGRQIAMGPDGQSSSGSRQATYRAERLEPPWIMAGIVLLTGLMLLIAMPDRWRDQPIAWMLLAALQLLLAVRWIVGLEGVFLDETLDWRAIMISDGVAYVALPAVLTAFGLLPEPQGQKGLGLAAFVAGACISLKLAFGLWPPWRQLAVIDLALAASAIGLALLAAAGGSRAWARLRRAAGWPLARPALGFVSAVGRWLAKQGGRMAGLPLVKAMPAWGWVLVAALLFRLGVGLFGVKERFSFPMPLAVSAVYLPWLLIGFAMLFETASRQPKWFHPWTAGGFMAAAVAAPAVMSDTGFAIMAIPLAIWGFGLARRPPPEPQPAQPAPKGRRAAPPPPKPRGLAALARRWAPGLEGLAWRAPLGAIALVLIAALVGPLFFRLGASDDAYRRAAASSRDEPALNLVRANAISDTLELRFYTLFNPTRVSTAGTSEAEKLRVWSAYLTDYTSSWNGRGYLQPSRFGPLSDVHLTDNVGAVHVMSPFGRLGAAAFVAFLAALAIACHRLAPPTAAPGQDWRRIAGLLALWSIFGAGAYMILANLQLTPFTGRNIYFLAAKSNSDLVEGMLLFLMAYWGLVARPMR